MILTREPYRIKNFWLLNPHSEELQVAPLFPGLETLRLDFVFQVGNKENINDDDDDDDDKLKSSGPRTAAHCDLPF